MDLTYLEGLGQDCDMGIGFAAPGMHTGHWGYLDVGPGTMGIVFAPDVRRAFTILKKVHVESRYGLICSFFVAPSADDWMVPHLKAAESAGIDVESTSELLFLPPKLASDEFFSRRLLAETLVSDNLRFDRMHDMAVARLVLTQCERNGFIWDGKLVKPRFTYRPTRTERFQTEKGSFRCMAINKEDRHLLTARNGRTLVVFDFNAMDGRSIVSMHPDASKQFGGAEDLYADMFSHVFGAQDPDDELRGLFKLQFFKHAYGAGENLSPLDLQVRDAIFAKMPWLRELREQNVSDEDRHAGHGMAIAAQRTSSRLFRAALREASRTLLSGDGVWPLFTVHDELVVEVDDVSRADGIARDLELGAMIDSGVLYRVKYRTGRSYAECKD